MAAAGSTSDGQAAEHSKAPWHRQRPSSWSMASQTARGSTPRGSTSIRSAAARAAGPR